MRFAYADPPYPGKAHLYPENTEVDHSDLIALLETFDGWALSTWEPALAEVLALCPVGVRVLAWCRSNEPPFHVNPCRSWEPVIVSPGRTPRSAVRSYLVTGAPTGFLQRDGLTGQKSAAFCEWVLRCMGADVGDELEDLFPGTGIMGRVWSTYRAQPELPFETRQRPQHARNELAAVHVGRIE